MKKVIDGKLYNTDTAKAVGHWDNGIYGDINSISETLYQKRTGEFFIHGEGGARTCYAGQTGRMFHNGESIRPLSWNEARSWAEQYLTSDEYESIFGEIPEDDSKVTINFYLPSSLVEQIKRDASKAGMSLSAYVEQLLSR